MILKINQNICLLIETEKLYNKKLSKWQLLTKREKRKKKLCDFIKEISHII